MKKIFGILYITFKPVHRIIYVLLILICGSSTLLAQKSDQISGPTAADSLIRRINLKLTALDPKKSELIPLFFIQAGDLEKEIGIAEDYLKDHPPVTLQGDSLSPGARIAEMKSRLALLRPIIMQKMQNIHHVLYDEAMEVLAAKDSVHARDLFSRSLQYNQAYGPSWYELIKLSLNRGDCIEAATFLGTALKKIDSLENTYHYNLIRDMSGQVFIGFLQKSRQLVSLEKYFDALDILEAADTFAVVMHLPYISSSLAFEKSRALIGIYHSFLVIGRRAMEAGKTELASIYINKAKDFQVSHSSDIPSGEEWHIASDQLDKAKTRIYEKPLDLTKVVFAGKHKPTLYQSKHHENKHISEKAERTPPKKTSVVALSDTLPELSAKPFILESVRNAYFIVWKNQLDSAVKILDENQADVKRCHLGTDPEIEAAIKGLESRIKEKKCFNLQTEQQLLLDKATQSYTREYYSESKEYLAEAGIILETNKYCPISDSLYQRLYSQYTPVYRTTGLLKEANDALFRNETRNFLIKYEQAWTSYNALNPKPETLHISSLADRVGELENPAITLELVSYFLEKGEYPGCLLMLNKLESQGIESESVKGVQEQAGEQIARYLYKEPNPRLYGFIQSLDKKPWFRSFNKSYLRTIKQIKENTK